MNTKLLVIYILLTANIFAQEKHVKIFPFKSAIIEYKYEAGLGGTHVKYIDDYGYKQTDIIKKEIKIGDEIEEKYETIILVGSRAYTINYEDSTVAIGRNATYSYYININRTPREIQEALIKVEGFKESGTKQYLGKKCKVWKADKAKKLTWNGVELKSTISFFMMMVEKATKIEVDVDLPKNVFDIPQGLRYISSDVYQGYSGLELKFDEDVKLKYTDDGSIKIKFNSSDLESTDRIPLYSQEGEEIIQTGENDYNKVDFKIIKSQLSVMNHKTVELQKYQTIAFIQKDGYGKGYNVYGKVQINKIEDGHFSYRYIAFGDEEEITGYSDDDSSALTKIFDIKTDKNNWKLILTPKNGTKCLVLGL